MIYILLFSMFQVLLFSMFHNVLPNTSSNIAFTDSTYWLIGAFAIAFFILILFTLLYVRNVFKINNIHDKRAIIRLSPEFLFAIIALLINIILAIYLSCIVFQDFMSPEQFQAGIVIVFIVLIAVIMYFIWNIYNKTTNGFDEVSNYIQSLNVKDITINYVHFIIIISEDSVNEMGGHCKFIYKTGITNHMEEIYKKFTYEFKSHEGISTHHNVSIDGEEINIKDIKFTDTEICFIKKYTQTRDGKIQELAEPKVLNKAYGLRFDIPINIKQHQTRHIEIVEESCPSMKKLNSCNHEIGILENIGYMIRWHTVELKFTVKLDDKLTKKGYTIGRGSRPDKSGDFKTFKVLDSYEYPMEHYEKYLEKHGLVPRHTKHRCEEYVWTIPMPKVSYNYLMDFTVLPPDKKRIQSHKPCKKND